MQAELRDLERAVTAGIRRRPRSQDRAPPAGNQRRAGRASRQQLARQALREPKLDAARLVYIKALQIIRAFDAQCRSNPGLDGSEQTVSMGGWRAPSTHPRQRSRSLR
jgi:hypothetical protein